MLCAWDSLRSFQRRAESGALLVAAIALAAGCSYRPLPLAVGSGGGIQPGVGGNGVGGSGIGGNGVGGNGTGGAPCSPGLTECSTGCVDLSTDGDSCGRCAHSCRGGDCTDGLCVPTVLAVGQSRAEYVAVDDTSVYWTDLSAGTVMKAPLSGGTPVTLATGQSNPAPIAVNAGGVYWSSYGDDRLMLSPAGGGMPIFVLSAPVDRLTVDRSNVYWTDNFQGTVMKVAVGSSSSYTLASGQGSPDGLAVDASNVYWADYDTGTVSKVPIGGGAPVVLVPAQGGVGLRRVAVDAASVYWTDGGVRAVLKVPVGGGAPLVLAAGRDDSMFDIAVDATDVYWSEKGGVMRVARDGGSPEVVVTGQPVVLGIALDRDYVYWTSGSSGVLRVPK